MTPCNEDRASVPEGMVAYGPEHPDYPNAPRNWRNGEVMLRDGRIVSGLTGISNWLRTARPDDIIAYLPSPTSAAPPSPINVPKTGNVFTDHPARGFKALSTPASAGDDMRARAREVLARHVPNFDYGRIKPSEAVAAMLAFADQEIARRSGRENQNENG